MMHNFQVLKEVK
jgi:hypothetical protein